MKITGADIGIASKGTFGPGEFGFVTTNTEIVILIDQKNNWEFVGGNVSLQTNIAEREVTSTKEALEFAKTIGFPKHGLVVRKNAKDTKYMVKGIVSEKELIEAVEKILRLTFNKKVYI